MTTPPRAPERTVPIYPAMFFVAWIVVLFSSSTASLNALVRPLLLGILIIVIVQLVFSGIARNRHLGAALVVMLLAALIGQTVVALIFSTIVVAFVSFGILKRLSISSLPWSSLTRLLNVVAMLTVGIALVSAAADGALTPIAARDTPRVASDRILPDIYLVLLDAYPRSDTLASDFSVDNRPFLDQMGTMGFDLSANSHSNYNLTSLTLASMFNVSHASDLPDFAESGSAIAEYRALFKAINRGRVLGTLQTSGYEIVSIPSGFSNVTLFDSDRVLDGGQLTDFEIDVTQQGAVPGLMPDILKQLVLGQLRERVTSTFDTLTELASERADHPRFVFAHLLSPHAPPVFGPDGEARDGWPCYPRVCSLWYGGQVYGDEAVGPIGGQVEYINSQIASTAGALLESSERPPVIVFFSDHGSRYDFDDTDEMLRSFLIAHTPDHPHLFPDDATPINIIPRLLNAYAATDLPLASEESYWVDQRKIDIHGQRFDVVPWPVVEAP